MVPTYPSGLIGFSFCSKKYHPVEDFIPGKADALPGLKYYSKDIHKAAFALPRSFANFLEEIK
jgi:spermidine synthase